MFQEISLSGCSECKLVLYDHVCDMHLIHSMFSGQSGYVVCESVV